MKYFAYGSNMLEQRLKARAPSAVFAGSGVARGHRLVFHKDGMDGSGKCTLEAAREAAAYGVLFDMADAEWARLDEAEGAGYTRTEIPVDLVGCGSPVHAHTYIANSIDAPCAPFEWYKALVVAGAREHGLPEEYVRELEEVAAVRDPDDERREAARGLLGCVAGYRIRPPAGFRLLVSLYDALCAVAGYGKGFKRWLIGLAGPDAHQRVLDVGCGTGTLAILVRETFPGIELDAVDPDPGALAVAERKARRKRLDIRFHEARAEELPFESGSFDRVLTTLAFHHIPDDHKGAALREIRRVLRPDGVLLLADFEMARPRGLFRKARSRQGLDEWLREAGFAPVRLAVRRGVHVWQAT